MSRTLCRARKGDLKLGPGESRRRRYEVEMVRKLDTDIAIGRLLNKAYFSGTFHLQTLSIWSSLVGITYSILES